MKVLVFTGPSILNAILTITIIKTKKNQVKNLNRSMNKVADIDIRKIKEIPMED